MYGSASPKHSLRKGQKLLASVLRSFPESVTDKQIPENYKTSSIRQSDNYRSAFLSSQISHVKEAERILTVTRTKESASAVVGQ